MSWLSVASRILGSTCGGASGRLVSTVLRPKHQSTTAATRFRSTHAADCDAVVIGAGVIGLAVARALALQGWSVVVLEAGSGIGTGTSSRNSEVIHAGIYYPPGSLKALLCVEGKRKLYELCAQRSIPHRRIGKLIVATADEQRGRLLQLAETAARNGVADLQLLEPEQVAAMEPELSCVAALHSPSTGIVDSHALMLVLQGDAEAKGAVFAFHSEVVGGQLQSGSSRPHRLDVRDTSGDCSSVFATHVINAAGLSAHHVARQVAGFPQEQLPPLHLAKGNYFALRQSRPPFQRLVYPVPPEGGLGVHLTLDLSGRARFGPDVEWLPGEVDGVAERSLDFSVDASRAAAFEQGIRQWWPGLPAGQLQPDYSGVRPKLSGPGEPAADFLVQDCGRWVDLLGVESPGLTSALAIADKVAGMLE